MSKPAHEHTRACVFYPKCDPPITAVLVGARIELRSGPMHLILSADDVPAFCLALESLCN